MLPEAIVSLPEASLILFGASLILLEPSLSSGDHSWVSEVTNFWTV
jgi:hypothetical protein